MDTFNPRAFKRLKEAEKKHFWFHVRRKWILDRIMKYFKPPAKILEIGCGTGNVSSFLSSKGYKVIGCEYFYDAITIAWPGFLKVQGDGCNLPFKNNTFDLVGLFDMIEHFQNESILLKEAKRVLKNEGIIMITVPAQQELWSYRDEKAMHKRRYSKDMLEKIFLQSDLVPLFSEYMFMSLYIPIKYLRGKDKKIDDQFKINRLINILLKGIFEAERYISKKLSLPIGTSLIAVAKKSK